MLSAFKYYLLAFFLALALMGSGQTGILDPLPLLHRSVNLAVAPLVDPGVLSDGPGFYTSVWVIVAVFLTAVFLYVVDFFIDAGLRWFLEFFGR